MDFLSRGPIRLWQPSPAKRKPVSGVKMPADKFRKCERQLGAELARQTLIRGMARSKQVRVVRGSNGFRAVKISGNCRLASAACVSTETRKSPAGRSPSTIGHDRRKPIDVTLAIVALKQVRPNAGRSGLEVGRALAHRIRKGAADTRCRRARLRPTRSRQSAPHLVLRFQKSAAIITATWRQNRKRQSGTASSKCFPVS